ncbi:MAG TPA: Tn3 family transposase [Pseudonocardiaceae bacterium]|nr:Tn3 family transposase [Pseudonocardiaceae bacterium]
MTRSRLQFSSDTFADNDPDHQDKLVTFNELVADCLIYNTTLDLTAAINDLAAKATRAAREDLATVSPYLTSKTRRFGQWALNLTSPPAMVRPPEPPGIYFR